MTPLPRDSALQAMLMPLRPWLDAPGVTDLCVNRPGELFVEQNGCWHRHEVDGLGFAQLQALARALATYTGQHIDEQQPLLGATLPARTAGAHEGSSGGSERVQVVIPPVVEQGIVGLCIRKPSQHHTTLGQLARGLAGQLPTGAAATGLFDRRLADGSRLSALDEELLELLRRQRIEDFLRLAVRGRRTIVLAGRTGSGKTTLMRALIEEIETSERLVTIEDAAELFMPRHPNTLHLFYSRTEPSAASRISASSLLEACLRLRPDRILLSEMRGEEAFAFLRLAASGHPGSLTSVHAGSTRLAFDQIALMARQHGAGMGLTLPQLQALARSVVDIVVHMDGDAGGRFISDIHFDPTSRLAPPALPVAA